MIFLTILLQTAIGDPDQFNNFLIFGMAVTWIIGLIYVVYIVNQQRNVQQDITILKRLLEEQDETDS